MIDLNEGPCILKLLKGCGCGNEYIAVTPDGDIYPCHQFVGQKGFKMGNVLDKNGSFDNDLKTTFSKTNIFTKKNVLNVGQGFSVPVAAMPITSFITEIC